MPAPAVVDEHVRVARRDRLAATSACDPANAIGVKSAAPNPSGQRLLRPALAVAQQHPALPDGVAALRVARREGDVHQVSLEAHRAPRGRAPTDPSPRATATSRRGPRPRARGPPRAMPRRAGCCAPPRPSRTAGTRASSPRPGGSAGRCRRARPPAPARRCHPACRPGAGATEVSGPRADTGHELPHPHRLRGAGHVERSLEPALVDGAEGPARVEVAAAARHPLEGRALEPQVRAAVGLAVRRPARAGS